MEYIYRFFKLGFLPAAYLLMLLVMFVLPFFSVEEYSILKNTTSHLGAQGAPNAWVMNVSFALLGLASIIDSWSRLSQYWFYKVIITIFGISLILTAFFQHAPIVPDVVFSQSEDNLHSIFATITGFSFTLFAILAAFIEQTKLRKIFAGGTAVVAILLSWFIFNVPDLAGVWQRIMFMAMFGWLMFFLYTLNPSSQLHG